MVLVLVLFRRVAAGPAGQIDTTVRRWLFLVRGYLNNIILLYCIIYTMVDGSITILLYVFGQRVLLYWIIYTIVDSSITSLLILYVFGQRIL